MKNCKKVNTTIHFVNYNQGRIFWSYFLQLKLFSIKYRVFKPIWLKYKLQFKILLYQLISQWVIVKQLWGVGCRTWESMVKVSFTISGKINLSFIHIHVWYLQWNIYTVFRSIYFFKNLNKIWCWIFIWSKCEMKI